MNNDELATRRAQAIAEDRLLRYSEVAMVFANV